MNRNNIWIHVSIAVVIITLAAVLGQIRVWENSLRANEPVPGRTVPITAKPAHRVETSEPEVLVRFKPGVSLSEIKRIAARYNDSVDDEIESVSGLVAIDDFDNANADDVAAQYTAMSDYVEYAQPNYEIRLDPEMGEASGSDLLYRTAGMPNDPEFGNQWALNNLGQDGGRARADIDALKAWVKTRGSEKVVVAVLDSGVDYNHQDLVTNIWTRPDNVPQYADD